MRRLYARAYAAQRHQEVIDRHLSHPAPWAGGMRRENAGHAQFGDSERYANAYRRCSAIAVEPDWQPSLETLLMINRLVGGNGRLRHSGVHVGEFRRFPASHRLPYLVSKFIAAYNAESEPPVAAALRLHLRLVTVHPFADANGRSARLMASMCLMSVGFRSTLVAAVEEIFGVSPWTYIRVLARFWLRSASEVETLDSLMSVYLSVCSGVALIRERELRLWQLCDDLSVDPRDRDALIRRVELGDATDASANRLRNAMASLRMQPWRTILFGLPTFQRQMIGDRLVRLHTEELADRRLSRASG